MYGIIHGGPVVPLTLSHPGGSLVPPLAHDVCQRYIILFFSFPIICDFYVNPYLFSGFHMRTPSILMVYVFLFVLDLIAYMVILCFFIYNLSLNYVIHVNT